MGSSYVHQIFLEFFNHFAVKEVAMRKVIKASEGHILTDGKVYGSTIYLAEGENGEDFHEITDEEYEAKMAAEELAQKEKNG